MQDQFNLYVKLMEECGETIHAAAKVLKRGRHGVEKYILSEECGVIWAADATAYRQSHREIWFRYEPVRTFPAAPLGRL